MAQLPERRASNAEVAGGIPAGSATTILDFGFTIYDLNGVWFAPNSRGAGFRNREPWRCNSSHADQLPTAPVVQCRGSGLKPRPVSMQVRPGAPAFAHRASARRASFGAPTGRAGRASVLTSARLRACGASPRRSAKFHIPEREADRATFRCTEAISRWKRPAGDVPFARVAQQQRHDVENVASAGATPAASTIRK